MKIWLSPEILNWGITILRNSTDWGGDNVKPYDFLEYTKKRFEEVHMYGTVDEENFVLNDIVINLKQAIEHREKRLHKKFKFSQLSCAKHKRYEQREQFHIVQPIFANKLRELRNEVIHKQTAPLGKEKKDIEELWEFVWYFLRATDVFLARYIEGTLYFPPETETIPVPIYSDSTGLDIEKGFLYVEGFEPEWDIRIRGEGLPAKLFSVDEKEGWIELKVGESRINECFESYAINKNPAYLKWSEISSVVLNGGTYNGNMQKDFDGALDAMKPGRKERIEDYLNSGAPVDFEGEIVGPEDRLERIIKQYFALYFSR